MATAKRNTKPAASPMQRLNAGVDAAFARIGPYMRLTRLERPIGSFLLLWPMLWALWIAAEGFPDPWVLGVFVLGVLTMRSAGCAINDFADRKIDGRVKRTVGRPLATGELQPWQALATFVVLCLVSLALVLTLNGLTIALSVVGAFLAGTYPFMKRYTHLPQVYLGAAFGWAVPMAFAAQIEALPPIAWLLFVAAVVWSVIYDTEYAMVDRDDDLKLGVKSTAILFGEHDRLVIGVLQLLMLVCLLMIGARAELGGVYYVAVGYGALLFLWQQYLIRDRDRDRCFQAFLNNNWLGAGIFIAIVLHYAYR